MKQFVPFNASEEEKRIDSFLDDSHIFMIDVKTLVEDHHESMSPILAQEFQKKNSIMKSGQPTKPSFLQRRMQQISLPKAEESSLTSKLLQRRMGMMEKNFKSFEIATS